MCCNPGSGKTALALHWSHQVRDRFPDGQLYLNLRGFDPTGQALEPAAALRQLLHALDIAPHRIPDEVEARSALYRSVVADGRFLVLLDNARDTGQVVPLLPGAAGGVTVVTSRNQLTGLVAAHGARPVTLDLLTVDQARDLLTQRLGVDRIAAEPGAVEDIIARCARLPVALAVVAAHAALHPGTALELIAAGLSDAEPRWHTLTGDNSSTDVRSVFSWSYHALRPDTARLFRLLGTHPGPDLTAAAAASLGGTPPARTRAQLTDLVRASLVTEPIPGRYALHDLLRAYAAELAADDPEHAAALSRVFDHYGRTAVAGDEFVDPHGRRIDPVPAADGVVPEPVTDLATAVAWYTTELPVLLALLRLPPAPALESRREQLAWGVGTFLERHSHNAELAEVFTIVLASARRRDDRWAAMTAHRVLGLAYTGLRRHDDAHEQLRHALALAEDLGDVATRAGIHHTIAYVHNHEERFADALTHVERAVDLHRAAGNAAHAARALNAAGWCRNLLGDVEGALRQCQEAIGLLAEVADRYGQGACWDSIGCIHYQAGRYTDAVDSFERALALLPEPGNHYERALVLAHLGDTHHQLDDPTAAGTAWRRARTVFTAIDHEHADAMGGRLDGSVVPGRDTVLS